MPTPLNPAFDLNQRIQVQNLNRAGVVKAILYDDKGFLFRVRFYDETGGEFWYQADELGER